MLKRGTLTVRGLVSRQRHFSLVSPSHKNLKLQVRPYASQTQTQTPPPFRGSANPKKNQNNQKNQSGEDENEHEKIFENNLYGSHVRLSVFNFLQLIIGVVISQGYFILQANKLEFTKTEERKEELATLETQKNLTEEQIAHRDDLRMKLLLGERPKIGFRDVLGTYLFKDWFFTVVPLTVCAVTFVKFGLRSSRIVHRIDLVPRLNVVRFWTPNTLLGKSLRPVSVDINKLPRVDRIPPIEDALFTVQPTDRKWKYVVDQRGAKFKDRDLLMKVLCGRGLKPSLQQSMTKLKDLGYHVPKS